jgi:ribosomal protein S13
MKRKLRLTESDLVNLVGKIIEEQSHDESAFEEHMGTIDHIANHFNNGTTEDELDFMLTQIEYELDSAVRGGELTDDELEELHDYANDIARELEMEFMSNNDLHEGTKAKKPKAMRSKRSGVKTQKTINQNHEILKKLK